jgi:hypothetical protein
MNTIVERKLRLIKEQTSPLQRIMWVYNIDEPAKRSFENNICSFHVGNGYFLSVSHNLRMQAGYYKSIDDALFTREVLPKLDGHQKSFLEQCYFTDLYTRKRYLNNVNAEVIENITKILKQKRFDTRWVAFAEKGVCTPCVIFQFNEHLFYRNVLFSKGWKETRQFWDTEAGKYTFLAETELMYADYAADIALYKMKDVPQKLTDLIPSVEISFDLLDETCSDFYCLQSSPNSVAGRLLNEAKIEGILDHFGIFTDEVEGNYKLEGYRYLVKGYFRFGSSGAPYLYFDNEKQKYVANAIQSEASGIQLSINNDRNGNFQYINAIASPLYTVKDELTRLLRPENRNKFSL